MFNEIISNYVITSVAISLFICEIWKFIDASIRQKKPSWAALIENGGMPSSHATLSVSLATSVGFSSGFLSDTFLVALVFAMIVVRDAFGVRRTVDKLGKTVNEIINKKKLDIKAWLKITGHTPIQTAVGVLLGVIIPTTLKIIFW